MKKKKEISKVKIWTYEYRFMQLGGNLHAPIFTMALPIKSFSIGKINLHIFQNPNNKKFHIAEDVSGGLVGHGSTEAEAVAQVSKDLTTAPESEIIKQCAKEKTNGDNAEELTEENFWKKIK